MTIDESKFLLMTIESLYPNCKFSDVAVTSRTWCSVLFDKNIDEVMQALILYARTDTSGFAPSPGALISLTENTGITPEEAVALVRKAAGNSIYHSREEYEKLPETVRKAIGSPATLANWGRMSTEEFETVCLSHFRRAFSIQAARDRTERLAFDFMKAKALLGQNNLLTQKEKNVEN